MAKMSWSSTHTQKKSASIYVGALTPLLGLYRSISLFWMRGFNLATFCVADVVIIMLLLLLPLLETLISSLFLCVCLFSGALYVCEYMRVCVCLCVMCPHFSLNFQFSTFPRRSKPKREKSSLEKERRARMRAAHACVCLCVFRFARHIDESTKHTHYTLLTLCFCVVCAFKNRPNCKYCSVIRARVFCHVVNVKIKILNTCKLYYGPINHTNTHA